MVEYIVAPLVGAWIEIMNLEPSLKQNVVAPLVGAWIEINDDLHYQNILAGRSPRGSVD